MIQFSFRDLPIARKIVVIIFSGMTASMLFALSYLFFVDRNAAKVNLTQEMTTLAKITGTRSHAAMAFGDSRRANENLKTLSFNKSIQAACIYTQSNTLFAKYQRSDNSTRFKCHDTIASFEEGFFNRTLTVIEEVANKSQELGYVMIMSDQSPIAARTENYILFGSALIVIAFLVTSVMTRKMNSSISGPLSRLNSVITRVENNNDLSLRAPQENKDEVGELVSSFNNMLVKIEQSNEDLKIMHDDLVEKSVEAESIASELETRNNQIKEMLSGAAHDLRQPLQALSIFVEALALQKDEQSRLDLMDKIQRSMNNLNELFDEVLNVSKAEHLATENELQPLSIATMLEKLKIEFLALSEKRGLKFSVRTLNIELLSIPGILERVIRNLISNAIKYTDSGGVLAACRQNDNGLFIEIWDTGRGIPENKVATIFNKFERVDDTDEERKSSFGMGLALVKQFIDMLGYDIQIHSRFGRGSCFRIHIPEKYIKYQPKRSGLKTPNTPSIPAAPALTAEPAPQKDEAVAPTRSPVESKTDLKESNSQASPPEKTALSGLSGTVLLVDDDHTVREAVKAMLTAWGLNVVDFDSKETVIQFTHSRDDFVPDVILSDFNLAPDVTGVEVLSQLLKYYRRPVPALIITGNRDQSVLESILFEGFQYMKKPVSGPQLHGWLKVTLGSH